jgi:hypothetical protein
MNMDIEGKKRKSVANRKKGATPSQSQLNFRVLGRSNGMFPSLLDFLATTVTRCASSFYKSLK